MRCLSFGKRISDLIKKNKKSIWKKKVFPSYVSEKTRDSFTNSPPVSTSKRIITSHRSTTITTSRDGDSDLMNAVQTGVVMGVTAMATEKILSSVFDSDSDGNISSCQHSDSVVWNDDN